MEEFVVMLEAKLENDEMSFEGAVNKPAVSRHNRPQHTIRLGQQS
jgi:hypothetical protein